MATPDWEAIQKAYCAGNESLRDIAARYGITEGAIRKRAAKLGWVRKKKTSTQSGTQVRKNGTQKDKVRTEQSRVEREKKEKYATEKTQPPSDTKPEPKRKVVTNHPPFQGGNQAALKHGGYARRMLWTDAVTEDARALTLEDELFRLRASNLVAAENIGRWTTQLEDVDDKDTDARKALLDSIGAAEKAMMRNTVRIESIERTTVVMNKALADTSYREATTEKVELEVGKLKLQLGKPVGELDNVDTTSLTPDEAADVYRQLMG
ncbi:hypothetical protein GW590_08285 [Rahnella sp. SAP-1]|uniref:Terminase n=1 Tax=Rouxiella aceris TaxID=2703884 RepID=A0A848MIF5_9GAMM|nr:hypothetical protein [Rouxiella aceris]NMP26860.1 hypothetical protein [Rouxiella aceris]